MAFHAFFGLIPLVAITGWAAHMLTQSRRAFLAPLSALTPMPVAAIADAEYLRLSQEGAAVLAPLSGLGFLWPACLRRCRRRCGDHVSDHWPSRSRAMDARR